MHRLFFWWLYLRGKAQWDTGITPPEIVKLIEEEGLSAGQAIDLGCGTGTNAIYLARHGWQVVGVDYVRQPIRAAKRKAAQAGVDRSTHFLVGDVAQLGHLDIGGPFDLAVDIGCGHSLPREAQDRYAAAMAKVMRPGGTFMVFMFRPTPERTSGLTPEQVETLFSDFKLVWSDLGQDTTSGLGSAWYRFERME